MKDDAALKRLAAVVDPDPWLVSDHLLSRSAPDVASRFAGLVPGPEGGKLRAYVAANPDRDRVVSFRNRLDAVGKASAARDFEGAVASAGDALGEDAKTISHVVLQRNCGVALALLRRWTEAAALLLRASDAAERIGWHRYAIDCLDQSALAAYSGNDADAAIERWGRVLKDARASGSREALVRALGNMRLAQVVEKIQRASKEAASLVYPPSTPPTAIRASLAQDEAIVWFNAHRPHQGLGGRTPDDVFAGRTRAVRSVPLRATLEVTHVDGNRDLPILHLRPAA